MTMTLHEYIECLKCGAEVDPPKVGYYTCECHQCGAIYGLDMFRGEENVQAIRQHREALAAEAFELYVKDLTDGELDTMLFTGTSVGYGGGMPNLQPYVERAGRV